MNKQQKILIKDKLKNIKYKNLHNEIFKMLLSDDKFKYTSNMSGLYFDINILDISTLDKLNELLNIPIEKTEKIQYNAYHIEKYSNSEEDKAKKLQLNLTKLRIIM